MAKILVADDNSNVQKTMALALADLGVEMVSVNNGEAAVRKLADVSPDLVLADIFMPVRNGYEVCEYVKKDSRFAHVPVILLVGAFDPLDEREAQRVGADGILKKPFVPPDPLISMVKALLDRSMSERLVAVSASKPAVAVQVKGASSKPKEASVVTQAPISEEPPELPASPGRVSFGEGGAPVAFGQLLDTPTTSSSIGSSGTGVVEPMDDEQVLTSSRDANLGEPVFWRNDSPEEEVAHEEEHAEENKDEDISLHKWGSEDDSEAGHEARAALPSIEPVEHSRPLEPLEPLELVREDDEVAAPSHVDSGALELDQAAQASLTVEPGKAPELAANPLEWLATAPPQSKDPVSKIDMGWEQADSPAIPLEPEPFPGRFKIEPGKTLTADTHNVAAEPFSLAEITEESASASSVDLLSPHQNKPTVPGTSPIRHEVELAPDYLEPEHASDELHEREPAHSGPSSLGSKEKGNGKEKTADTQPFPDFLNPASSVETAHPAEFKTAPTLLRDSKPPAQTSEQAHWVEPPPQSPEDTAKAIPTEKWAEMTDSLEARTSEILKRKLVPVTVAPSNAPAAEQPPVSAVPLRGVPPPQPPLESEAIPHFEEIIGSAASGNSSSPSRAAESTPQTAESSPRGPISATPATPANPLSPDPALVEAVVQRVLDKMRPQVVDIITKEFLRPVVQALVHREIEKK